MKNKKLLLGNIHDKPISGRYRVTEIVLKFPPPPFGLLNQKVAWVSLLYLLTKVNADYLPINRNWLFEPITGQWLPDYKVTLSRLTITVSELLLCGINYGTFCHFKCTTTWLGILCSNTRPGNREPPNMWKENSHPKPCPNLSWKELTTFFTVTERNVDKQPHSILVPK